MKLRITSIQRGCVYDGPGVRTTVFLKGCTMRCPWCCNPETISFNQEFFIDESKCILVNGGKSIICNECVRNGGKKSIISCPFGVSQPVSKQYTADELRKILSKDFPLMKSSKGGVTFSGGEPLIQMTTLEPLVVNLKNNGIHIAFETTLTAPDESIQLALKYADLLIIDLKIQPEHSLYNNKTYTKNIISQIEVCREYRVDLQFRIVFLDSMNKEFDKVLAFIKMLRINSMELLKCHNLGKSKYTKLQIDNIDYTASDKEYLEFVHKLETKSIKVKTLAI